MKNYCTKCPKINNIIKFDDIKIEDEKIQKIKENINFNDININNDENIKIIKINDSYYEKLYKEERIRFKKLILIIINDYKNYPNYSHFFNIKNLLYFFNIENNPINKKEEKNDKLIEYNEPIIIEYINNNPYITKLFSKIFVKNNKKNFKIEIEGEILDLIYKYKFKKKNKKVRIKLLINKGISEINMYKMFANCTNLIYVEGILKLKKIKIINMNKIFYNCVSLSSIPDLNEFEMQKYNSYLMFYNCISLIFFSYEKKLKINKFEDGIIITKYFKYNKEISISNIIEDNKGYINLFRYKFKFKNEEIMVFNGNSDCELIACYKDEKKDDEKKGKYIMSK